MSTRTFLRFVLISSICVYFSCVFILSFIMSRAKVLIQEENGKISVLVQAGHSLRNSASLLQRSVNSVSHFVSVPDGYCKIHGKGKPRLLIEQDLQQIGRTISNSTLSVKAEFRKISLSAPTTTMWRAICALPNTERQKMHTAP